MYIATLRATAVATPGGGGGYYPGFEGDILNLGDLLRYIINLIGSFFSSIFNAIFSFFDYIGQIINWVLGTVANLMIVLGDVLNLIAGVLVSIFNFIVEVVEMIVLLISIVVRLIVLMIGWIVQMLLRLGILVNSFFSAPALPIPNLPQCVTAPTVWDICAIYWILDWTIFAVGTPGAVIVPILTSIIDVLAMLILFKGVMRLVRRGEGLSDAA